MKTEWLYSPVNYENGEIIGLDESAFEKVSIPHANRILDKHKGDDFMKQIDSYRFVSWYRRHFALDESYAGKEIYINFEGVANVADVYVNGRFVGCHKGAYTGFTFDITDFVNTDGSDNLLAVKVDSTKRSDVPPEGGSVDYCLFGGIVRDVNLIVKEKLHIDNIFVTTPNIKDGDGSVAVEAKILNLGENDGNISLTASVKDASGNIVATGEASAVSAKGSEALVKLTASAVSDVTLWNVNNPYLYTVEVKLTSDGKLFDSVSEKIGFRYFEFISDETESAFYLNGEKLLITGMNRHEQWPWIGRAVGKKYQAADADLIKASGLNAVRCSHYPQNIAFLDRCDEIGLLVMEEAPGWAHIGDGAWQNVYKTNVEEMILRDRNHASIITWGVRVNESPDCHDLYVATNIRARELDPSRPTHGVRIGYTYETTEILEDIFTVNYTYPETPRYTPYVISEYSTDWTSGNGFPGAAAKQAVEFTNAFAWPLDYIYGNKFCSGGFAWCMFDYNNEVNYTNTGHVFYSGIYDLFRYPKSVAYMYKAQQSPEDGIVLYIANYWADEGKQDVVVMSNCDEVELLVNGKSAAKLAPNHYTNLPHPMFKFTDIEFEKGCLTAVGYIGGKEVKTAVVKTPEMAEEIRLTPDYDTIIVDGADFTSVTVELIDKNGTVLPYASDEVTITVTGAGKFIGEETIALEGGHTAFFVQSEYLKTGEITCTVKLTNNGKLCGSCRLEAVEFDGSSELPQGKHENGSIEPKEVVLYDINDTVTGGNRNYFTYDIGWQYTSQMGCFNNDNHFSETAGHKCTLIFEGTGAELYCSKAPNHGMIKVSVDGGEESIVDCYNESREDNVVVFKAEGLSLGKHTITVEVTGEKNDSADGKFINIDRAVIIK